MSDGTVGQVSFGNNSGNTLATARVGGSVSAGKSSAAMPTAGAIPTSSSATRSMHGGLVVRTYDDGSGSVAYGPDVLSPRWSIDCRVDAMTDKRNCSFYKETGGPFIYYGSANNPRRVCIFGHDFPGRTGQIRIDKNRPISTDTEGCVPASQVMQQLRSGSQFTGRYYKWPYDYSRDHTTSLRGINETIEVIEKIRSGAR